MLAGYVMMALDGLLMEKKILGLTARPVCGRSYVHGFDEVEARHVTLMSHVMAPSDGDGMIWNGGVFRRLSREGGFKKIS